MAAIIGHLLTIYDEQLLSELGQAGFLLGIIPRTVVITEDFWGAVCQETTFPHSVEDALRAALHKHAINPNTCPALGKDKRSS